MIKIQRSLVCSAPLGMWGHMCHSHILFILTNSCLDTHLRLFFHSAPCLKDMQCACITWKTSVRHLTGLLHTVNGLTTTGRCTMAGSPTRDLDRWVIFAWTSGPSVTLWHNLFVITEIPVYKMSRCVAFTPLTHVVVWRPTWVNVEFWMLFLQTQRISHGRWVYFQHDCAHHYSPQACHANSLTLMPETEYLQHWDV